MGTRTSQRWALSGLLAAVVCAAGGHAWAEPFTVECEAMTAAERAEVEARFRSGCLGRGVAVPALLLVCGPDELRISEPRGDESRSVQTPRSREPLVEQFARLLFLWLDGLPEGDPAGSPPHAVPGHASSPAAEPAAEVARQSAPRAGASPGAGEMRPSSLARTPSLPPIDAEAAWGTPTFRWTHSPPRTWLFAGPLFALWATDYPGAVGLELGVRHARGPWGLASALGGSVSVTNQNNLRPFDATAALGIFWRPIPAMSIEGGGLIWLAGMMVTEGEAPLGVTGGGYAKARWDQPVAFGSVYAELGARFANPRVLRVVEAPATEGAPETVLFERVIIPAVSPAIAFGVSFRL